MNAVLLAQKSVQSQRFDEKSIRIPTTTLICKECYVEGVMQEDGRGYNAVRIAYGPCKQAKKTIGGILNKAGIKAPLSFLKEFRFDAFDEVKEGESLKFGEQDIAVGTQLLPAQLFKVGDMVSISGVSKGKGFQGVVRRHKFAGGPKTHGQSDRHRAPGSMGQTTTPGHTYKGKRMAGRMGGVRSTTRGLQVVEVTENTVIVKGLVPGAIGGYVEIKKTN